MNEGWLILGGVFLGGLVTAELLVWLLKTPRSSHPYRLGRGLGMAIKSLFRR
jgi:hypothetical protein